METNYKKLIVWQKSIVLVKEIYLIILNFPKNEQYWLVDQIKRSAISIPSNIAEWHERNYNNEVIRFLYIAKWSAAELETQLIIAKELWFISEDNYEKIESILIEILKMLSKLISNKKTL